MGGGGGEDLYMIKLSACPCTFCCRHFVPTYKKSEIYRWMPVNNWWEKCNRARNLFISCISGRSEWIGKKARKPTKYEAVILRGNMKNKARNGKQINVLDGKTAGLNKRRTFLSSLICPFPYSCKFMSGKLIHKLAKLKLWFMGVSMSEQQPLCWYEITWKYWYMYMKLNLDDKTVLLSEMLHLKVTSINSDSCCYFCL